MIRLNRVQKVIQSFRGAHALPDLQALARTNKVQVDIPEFPLSYPEFLHSPVPNRRDPLYEKLVRVDMLERRLNLDIPEFYVGSILAVTVSDPNMTNRINRFLGICIRREKQGLHHQFTLRNVVNGLGVEVMYDLYNPTIRKIETIKLEKRLDNDLSYLIDAQPEFSTYDFNLEPLTHPVGQPVPVNPLKVKLRPPPWSQRWEMFPYEGIDNAWEMATPRAKRLVRKTKVNDYAQYDLLKQYRREGQDAENETRIQEEIREFEQDRQAKGATKRKILRSAESSV